MALKPRSLKVVVSSAPPTSDTLRWWDAHDERVRLELKALFSPRADSPSFAAEVDEAGRTRWRRLPRVEAVFVEGEFVPAESAPPGEEDWNRDLYENLIAHPEINIHLFEPRSFHICTAHRAARRALAEGVVPAEFACPLGREGCPMRALLDLRPGSALRLRGSGEVHPSQSNLAERQSSGIEPAGQTPTPTSPSPRLSTTRSQTVY